MVREGPRGRIERMNVVGNVAFIILAVLLLWLLTVTFGRWAHGIRFGRRAAGAFKPIVDPNPPAPVAATRWVWVVSWWGVLWSAGHLVAVAWWCVEGGWIAPSVPAAISAAYVCWASTMTLIGSLMLRARRPYGRRMVSLGQFLFVLGGFIGLGHALAISASETVAASVRRLAPGLAAMWIGHLVVDAALGAAAQRVGRAGESAGMSRERA